MSYPEALGIFIALWLISGDAFLYVMTRGFFNFRWWMILPGSGIYMAFYLNKGVSSE